MTFGQILAGVCAVGAILVGAFVPDHAILWMGLCVAGGIIACKFVP